MALEAEEFFKCLSNSFIAEMPNGVEAFPRPKRFAVIFELMHKSSSGEGGGFIINRVIGRKIFDINFVTPQSAAILSIPFQKHMVALMVSISFKQLSQASRQAEIV